jgi:hypothetical protein
VNRKPLLFSAIKMIMHMTSGTSPEHPANDIATHAVFLSSTWTRHDTFGGKVGRGILLIDCITAFSQKYLLNLCMPTRVRETDEFAAVPINALILKNVFLKRVPT